MSKREVVEANGATPEVTEEVKVEVVTSILDTIAEMGCAQPSLKALAEAVNVPQQRLYSVSKQPKEGEVYDRNVYNWDAITRFVDRRLEEGQTRVDIINKALELDAAYATSDKRRGPRATGDAADKFIAVGDKNVPKRKHEVVLGQEIVIQKRPVVHIAVFMTDTHVVLQEKGTSVLTCLSNWTLNQKMVHPDQVAAVIAKIEDGTCEWFRTEAPTTAPTDEPVDTPAE